MEAEVLVVVLLSLAWTILTFATPAWVFRSLGAETARLNVILILAFGAFAILRKDFSGLRLSPEASPLRLGVITVCAVVYVVLDHAVAMNRVSLFPWALGTFQILGLWIAPTHLRRIRLPALIVFSLLPFTEQLETYLGFPLRTLTAQLSSAALAGLDVGVSSSTILSFETGIAYIDAPCSGTRGLWAGVVLALLSAWTLRKPLSWRWCAALFTYVGFLFAANLFRVLTIVAVGVVLGLEELANILHEPIGLSFFATATAVFLALCLRLPGKGSVARNEPSFRATTLGFAASILLLGLCFFPAKTRSPVVPSSIPIGELALNISDIRFSKIELSDGEKAFFGPRAHREEASLASQCAFLRFHRERASHGSPL